MDNKPGDYFRFQAISLPGVSHVLAVASGKGGVGKTTIAVNLALALLRSSARVGLFDADLYGPNVPLMLGVRRIQPARGFVTIERQDTVPYIEPLERFGLKVMSLGFVVGDAEAVMPDPFYAGAIIRQTIRDIMWDKLDYLILDFPPGSGEPQQTLLKTIPIEGAVIVTTPQDLSLADASRSINMFRRSNVPVIGVVENMSYLNCPHCGKPVEIHARQGQNWIVDGDDIVHLGRIPMSISLGRRVTAEHPLLQPTLTDPDYLVFQDIASKVTGFFLEKH